MSNRLCFIAMDNESYYGRLPILSLTLILTHPTSALARPGSIWPPTSMSDYLDSCHALSDLNPILSRSVQDSIQHPISISDYLGPSMLLPTSTLDYLGIPYSTSTSEVSNSLNDSPTSKLRGPTALNLDGSLIWLLLDGSCQIWTIVGYEHYRIDLYREHVMRSLLWLVAIPAEIHTQSLKLVPTIVNSLYK